MTIFPSRVFSATVPAPHHANQALPQSLRDDSGDARARHCAHGKERRLWIPSQGNGLQQSCTHPPNSSKSLKPFEKNRTKCARSPTSAWKNLASCWEGPASSLHSPKHSGAFLTALAPIPRGPRQNQPETWCAALLLAQTDVGQHGLCPKPRQRSPLLVGHVRHTLGVQVSHQGCHGATAGVQRMLYAGVFQYPQHAITIASAASLHRLFGQCIDSSERAGEPVSVGEIETIAPSVEQGVTRFQTTSKRHIIALCITLLLPGIDMHMSQGSGTKSCTMVSRAG